MFYIVILNEISRREEQERKGSWFTTEEGLFHVDKGSVVVVDFCQLDTN